MIEASLLLVVWLVLIVGALRLWQTVQSRARSRRVFVLRMITICLLTFAVEFIGFYQLINARRFQLFGKVVARSDTQEPVVALTFDDGPNPPFTEQLLEKLRNRGVKATFFVIGAQVEAHPQLAKQIVAEGHELGNHSYSHERMILKSMSFVRDEFARTDVLIREAGYPGRTNFRSPYFKKFILLPLYLDKSDKLNILADVEPDSYPEIDSDTNRIVAFVVEHASRGSIILLHAENASRKESLNAVDGIIDGLKGRGLGFSTVTGMLSGGADDQARRR